MCGIVGHVSTVGGSPDRRAVVAGCDRLKHRGPDGSGTVDFPNASFGHRRLSIIDLELSNQPWVTQDKRFALVFNGEIYNYVELRNDLLKKGCVFLSDGDTEVLMQMYLHYGIECLNKLNGMFAFAIWDEKEQTLLLARDRLGKKPLYYSEFNDGIAFASEIGALDNFRQLDRAIDLNAVHDYFAYQFIPGGQSIYGGVKKLLPAHYLLFGNDRSQITRYWSPDGHSAKPKLSDLCESVRELVNDAVRIRLRSDVPLGVFLSGGLDSSIVLQSMDELGADIHSYTIGFKEESFDESTQSRQFAHRFRVNHHEKIIDFNPGAAVMAVTQHLGEPFADPSAVPTWQLCQYASETVTVALSGDGADELFGGYQRYRAVRYLQAYNKIPIGLRHKFIEPLVAMLRESSAYYGSNWRKKLKLFMRLAKRMELSPTDLLPQSFDIQERQNILDPELVGVRSADHIGRYDLHGMSLAESMMTTDIHAYLSEDILTKVDRMSMANSLEVRSPLLDHRIVEFAYALGNEWKLRGNTTKYLLRQAYQPVLPVDVLQRGKHGFDVPVGAWFRNELKEMFQDLVISADCPDYLQRREILKLWNAHQDQRGDYGVKLWTILIFFLWIRNAATRNPTH